MPPLAEAKASNDQFSLSYIPTAVFVGGTSGVGRAMAERMSHYLEGRLNVIIIGRNQAIAKEILDSLPTPAQTTTPLLRQFIYLDIHLMSNVSNTVSLLKQTLPKSKINYLILSAGYADLFHGRVETPDGLDQQAVSRYYYRFKFVYEALPLLRNARDAGEVAGVMSVLGGGANPTKGVPLHDLGLRTYRWGAGVAACYYPVIYNDYALEEFSIREQGIAFTHIYPGRVFTPAVIRPFNHSAFTMCLKPFFLPLIKATHVSADDCAEWMLFALFDAKEGFHIRTDHGDLNMKNYGGDPEVRKKIWDHSMVETKCVEES